MSTTESAACPRDGSLLVLCSLPDCSYWWCEHCHGLGTFHGTPGMETKVSEETCNGCHLAEGAPAVNYAQALAEGIHTQ